MSRKAGLWIDHRKAVVVTQEGDQTRVATILSQAEPKPRMAGGARSKTAYGPQEIASERNRDRRIQKELRHYYQEVAKSLGEVESLLVIGPGEAKKEFASEFLARSGNRGTQIDLEPADKMKETQIVIHITNCWHHRHYY